jgi:hypothetical protein
MIQLGGAGTLATMVGVGTETAAAKVSEHGTVRRWEVFEVALDGPSGGNPFTEVEFGATFRLGHRSVEVDGFYDGDGRYKLRFMPDTEGEWSYTTFSKTVALSGKSGRFLCVAAKDTVHGPVGVSNQHHFAYADGSPYFPFGTTCYAWIHQSEELQRETLASLKDSPFTKIRMCVFPKHYEYNHNEPALYPFERSASGVNDLTRPNPAFYAHLEQRILDLQELGIEADLILFHPYDRWGYASMPADADDRYLRYVVARLAAFRNVWWSLANEFDLMRAKTVQDFDRYFHIVEQRDWASHLRSVHYSVVMYDYAHPWVTHASLQTYDFEAAAGWLKAWRKPIVYDEIMYEGNLNKRWGNISGEEITRRFWLGTIAGCYLSHGETFLDPDQPLDENTTPTLWWSHGGKLHGTSPQRIGFLRGLVEETVVTGAKRFGLEASASPYYLNASSLDGKTVEQILYYFDFHQPIYYEFPLPDGTYTAEYVDPWAMTVTPVAGQFRGVSKLKLIPRPYQAIRFKRLV